MSDSGQERTADSPDHEESSAALPQIPAKRYFTIGEVSELCGVKPHVLRYWEQEFTQLRPMKRRGNRRYYQHHEVLLVRRIRELLYQQGFTISGARNRLGESPSASSRRRELASLPDTGAAPSARHETSSGDLNASLRAGPSAPVDLKCMGDLRHELERVLQLLEP
jgi:DNA-binding transcriptional MerR regulator